MLKQSTVCEAEVMDSEDTLFLLYTSGSTGKPKGIQHSQAGYLLYTNLTFEVSLPHVIYRRQSVSSLCYLSVIESCQGISPLRKINWFA